MTDAKHTPTPWKASLPDETLILGPDNQVVATTLQDEEDYQANYDRRAADAQLIVSSVNRYATAIEKTIKLAVEVAIQAERERIAKRIRETYRDEEGEALRATFTAPDTKDGYLQAWHQASDIADFVHYVA